MWWDDDDYYSIPYSFGSNDDMDDDSDDHYTFDDDYYYSSGEDYSDVISRRMRSKSDDVEDITEIEASTPSYQVSSLQDLCCRFISRRFPFAFIEHRSPPIPDQLQLKIIQFSFPEDEDMIRKYAEFSRSSVDFSAARRLVENGTVKDVNQIGFRLSATVGDRRTYPRRGNSNKSYVTIQFDRGKITSAHCSCELSTNWCVHVVATCLERIKNKDKISIHMPISDSLNLLDREQLLKFAQYLLSEHQHEPVVETAQQLLNRLLSRQQQDKPDDINLIAGAPDPTAGPGLDEEAHWFVSKSGFQSRCESLMYESQVDLGFISYNDRDNDRGSSVTELWAKNCFQQALVQDEMDLQHNDYCTYSSSRRLNVLKVLEAVADLLEDDFMSAVSALTMCTEQLTERLNKICRVDSPAADTVLGWRRAKEQSKENTGIFFGSLAGGFTPRISSCSTLSDEVSRLWRLTVLRPGVPPKQRKGMIEQLRTLNQTVSVAFMNGPLRPWHGLEVAVRLASINWGSDVFQSVLRGEWIQSPVVASCMAIHLTCQLKDQLVNWMEVDEGQKNEEQCRASRILSFHNPHCISFGPHCIVNIHSVCSMIEALYISSRHDEAMRLTVTLCSTLVLFYKGHLLQLFDAATLPVSARCHLGSSTLPEGVNERDHQTGNKVDLDGGQEMDPLVEINGESPMNVDAPNEEPNFDHVWPENTILSVTTFAFLFHFLSRKPDLAQECLAKMKHTLSEEISLHALEDAESLRFHIGVIGLLLQRLPAPSLHHEVEEYNYECWLTYQLICSSPTPTDLNFLAHLGQHLMGAATPTPTPTTTLAPPSSLTRVIFHHLFKGAPAALSKNLTEQQNIGLDSAFHVLGHVNKYMLKERSPSWMLFQYANCRLWAKLAEVVLRSLSDSPELLKKAMTYILQPSGMLGVPIPEGTSNETISFEVMSRLRNMEVVKAKCRIAYSLAKALSSKQGNTIKMSEYKAETGGRQWRRESVEMEMPRKIMKAGVGNALKMCAVQIAAHCLYLEKLSDRNRAHSDMVRWLLDFVVSSGMDAVKCLVKCEGGVMLFLAQSELLTLCEKVLQKFDLLSARDIVKSILLSLLEKASGSQKLDDMKKLVSFCRDKRCAIQMELLPWICQRLKSLAEGEAFLPFEVLMDASLGMFEHFKEKLSTQENINRRMWSPRGKLGLRRLFSDEGQIEDDSDNEDSDGLMNNRNPYKTSEPHPHLQVAFDLGMMGLEKIKERADEREDDWYPRYHRCPVKEHLTVFCRLVCYVAKKTWLTETQETYHKFSRKIRILDKPRKKVDKTIAISDDKPGCSHWEDAQSQSVSQKSSEDSYLHKFVCSLISNVDNPMWLFEVVKELGQHLNTEGARSSPSSRVERYERRDAEIKEACQTHPSVKLLLQRAVDEFLKLLSGPKMVTAVEEVTHRRDRRHLEPSEIMYELRRSKVMNTNMTDLLKTTKRALNILDSSGAKLKDLTEEISKQYPILQPLLDHVLGDKDIYSSDEREVGLFRSHAGIFPALVAHGLFPGMFESAFSDDYF